MDSTKASVAAVSRYVLYLVVILGLIIAGPTISKQIKIKSDYVGDGLVFMLYPTNPFDRSGPADTQTEQEDYPVFENPFSLPSTSAKAVLIYDVNHEKILYNYNNSVRLAPASTTKLATALVALDLYDLNRKLVVPENCTLLDTQSVGLPAGAVFTFKDLLYSLLIQSAGDAACVMYASVDYDVFVTKMNEMAVQLGMTNTRFTNPIGLDGINGGHYSTADDLLKLAVKATKAEIVREIVSTQEYALTSVDGNFSTTIYNTNQLLWEIPNTLGIKTGRTAEAGEVLIYQYEEDDKNLIIIVMGSEDRFYDTKTLLDWVLRAYRWGPK